MGRKNNKKLPSAGAGSPKVTPDNCFAAKKFLRDTSLHGLKYTADDDSNICEKWFWAVAFFTGLLLSTYLVTKVWIGWQDKPIVITVETTNEPIKNSKFPAVTVCPSQQILHRKILSLLAKFNISHDGNTITSGPAQHVLRALQLGLSFDETEPKSGLVSEADLPILLSYFNQGPNDYQNAMETDSDLGEGNINKVSPKCDDMIIECAWKNQPGCKANMRNILTPMGYCCTFNFPNFTAFDAERYSTANEGKGFGLQLVLEPRNRDSINLAGGHKVLVHDPYTYPYRPSMDMHVGAGQVLSVAVQPVVMESDDGLRSVRPDKRDCVFGDERPLGVKLPSTYHNCIMDCFSQYQQRNCSCVQGYLKPFLPNSKICGMANMLCVKNVLNKVRENLAEICDCRPPCLETVYNSEMLVRNITFKDIMFYYPDYQKQDYRNYALVQVFFKETRCTKFLRSLRYQWEDFIAATGGLLGVGFGFSLLSAVEILYFFGYKHWTQYWRATGSNTTPNQALDEGLWVTKPIAVNKYVFKQQEFIPKSLPNY